MELYTPLQVAKKMGVDRFTPYGWIKSGQLKAIDVSITGTKKARWVIREDDFNEFRAKYQNPPVKNKVSDTELVKEFIKIKNTLLELAIMMEELEVK